jgi:quercetin dioxygenase-like cupin family protein
MAIRVFHIDRPDRMMPAIISKDARLIVWPGTGSMSANMNYVKLEPGEANIPHIHAESEDTIFILEGRGTIRDFDHDLELGFEAGCALHVPVGVRHAVAADRGARIVSVGGPTPADWGMLKKGGLWPPAEDDRP